MNKIICLIIFYAANSSYGMKGVVTNSLSKLYKKDVHKTIDVNKNSISYKHSFIYEAPLCYEVLFLHEFIGIITQIKYYCHQYLKKVHVFCRSA